METQSPISTEPKKSLWIWLILILVLVLAGGYFVWNYYANKTTPVTTPTPSSVTTSSAADNLNAVDKELSNLDSDFDQLDKIDASEDETPNL